MELLSDTKIIVAIIAVFVSFIGLLISKEQKTSEFRQAWINTIREDISKLIGQINSVSKLVIINKTSVEEEKSKTSNDVILGSVEMRELQSKIELLINPKEKEHIELIALIDNIIQELKDYDHIFEYQKKHENNIKKLTTLSQDILKKEWDRVKDGEPIFKTLKIVLGIVTIVGIPYLIYDFCKKANKTLERNKLP